MSRSRSPAALGRLIAAAGAFLAGLLQAPGVAALPGDFNGDGVVDLTDLELLRQAMSRGDAAFDLSGDGVVDIEDFFVFGDSFRDSLPASQAAGKAAGQEGERPYQLLTTRTAVAAALPDFTVVTQRAAPFGITSLRLHGQPMDFVSPTLPMADWEWFWYEDPAGVRQTAKQLMEDWGPPALVRAPDHVQLTYGRRDVLRRGVSLSVVFQFSAAGPHLQATYIIENRSDRPLVAPYAMVGFPGFADHRWISEVADAGETVRPRGSFATFWEEALGLGRSYELTRHLADPASAGLRSEVAIALDERRYVLKSYCLSDRTVRSAYSAHTSKPSYLTSHLYATFTDLPPGQRRSLTIVHSLLEE